MIPTAEPQGSSPRRGGPGRTAALLLSCLALVAGLSAFSIRAYAAFVPAAAGPHLSLQSDPYPATFLDLSPGSVRHWQIQSSLVDPSSPFTLQFSRSGTLISHPRGLQVQVDRCDQEWTDLSTAPSCAAGQANVFGPAAASSIPETTIYDLAGITNTQDKFVLVTLSIPDSPAARADTTLMGLTADIGFGFTVSGDDSPAPPPRDLAFTGADVGGLALLGLGALGLGLVLTSARRSGMTNAGKESK